MPTPTPRKPLTANDVRAMRAAAQRSVGSAAAIATPATSPTPLLPNDPSVPQPTTTERAVIEAKWLAQREVPRSLAQLIILVNAHPEWLEWAREAEKGTMTFNG